LEDEEDYLIAISDRDARDGETTINFTDYPKIYLEKWRFDICNSVRNAYINKWGQNKYYETILNSQRYKKFKEDKKDEKSSDSGYFAEPARGQEKDLGLPEKKEIEIDNSLVSDTIHDKKEEIELTNNKIPSLYTLFKNKSISSIANFYPSFFWRTRRFTLVFIFLNELRKSGLAYAVKLAMSAIKWNLSRSKLFTENSSDDQGLSLRKALRKGNLPAITSGNPAMEKLRLGR
jgi:hypothetical protein